MRIGLVVVAALVVLGAGGFLAWQTIGTDDAADTASSETSGSKASGDSEATGEEGGSEAGESCSTEDLPDDVPGAVTCGFEATDPLGMGIGTGAPDAPVVVELYEDFMCPHCANFEAQTAQALAGYVEAGDVRVVRYPMTLTPFGRPTELAANAYACAADAGRAHEYAAGLFERTGTIWDTDTLFQAATGAGLADDADFVACVNEGHFEAWVASIDDSAMQRGVGATPTVFVNGEEVALSTTPLTEVEAAIEAALGGN